MKRAAGVPRRRRRPLVVIGGTRKPARFPCKEPLPAIPYRERRHRKPLRARKRLDQHKRAPSESVAIQAQEPRSVRGPGTVPESRIIWSVSIACRSWV